MDIPSFISADTAFWFSLVESIFTSKKVTELRDKINAILLALPNHLQLEAKPILAKFEQLAADDAVGRRQVYEELKQRIIILTSIPEEQKLQELLDNAKIGTRTPTQFLNYIRNLQGDAGDRNNKFLRTIFIRNLPMDIRNIVISQRSDSLDDMAATADLIWKKPDAEVFNIFGEPDGQALQTSSKNSLIQQVVRWNTAKNEETQELKLAINKLSKQMDDMQSEFSRSIQSLRSEIDSIHNSVGSQNFPRQNIQRNALATGRRMEPKVDSNTWCYFHQRFGNSAFRCSQPCSFSNQQGN